MEEKPKRKYTRFWRSVLEVSFIVFLFYSNLLMGEYSRSGNGQRFGLWWALQDIFTSANFMIAVVLGFTAHIVFDFFRKRL